jgi:hypothetical protein
VQKNAAMRVLLSDATSKPTCGLCLQKQNIRSVPIYVFSPAPSLISLQEGCENKKILELKERQEADAKQEKIKKVVKHEDFSKVPGLLEFIQSIGAAGAFRSDQMARAIMSLYSVTVDKQLLYRTAQKAHLAMFGKTQSDVLAMEELANKIESDGGRLMWVYGKDIGKTDPEDAEKYFGLVWIAPFCHILVERYGDMYTTDGTHGVSVNNWRAIPLCVVNSLKNPFPVAMAFATSENAAVLAFMARQIHKQCADHGITSPFSQDCDPADQMSRLQALPNPDALDEVFICMPEWRAFVHSVMQRQADVALIPNARIRPSFMSDGGPAFAAFAKSFRLWHVLCKMHLSALNTVGGSDK